jgi:hypothetical protein
MNKQKQFLFKTTEIVTQDSLKYACQLGQSKNKEDANLFFAKILQRK